MRETSHIITKLCPFDFSNMSHWQGNGSVLRYCIVAYYASHMANLINVWDGRCVFSSIRPCTMADVAQVLR